MIISVKSFGAGGVKQRINFGQPNFRIKGNFLSNITVYDKMWVSLHFVKCEVVNCLNCWYVLSIVF